MCELLKRCKLKQSYTTFFNTLCLDIGANVSNTCQKAAIMNIMKNIKMSFVERSALKLISFAIKILH